MDDDVRDLLAAGESLREDYKLRWALAIARCAQLETLAKLQADALTNLMGLADTPVERLHRQKRFKEAGATDDGFYDAAVESGRVARAAHELVFPNG